MPVRTLYKAGPRTGCRVWCAAVILFWCCRPDWAPVWSGCKSLHPWGRCLLMWCLCTICFTSICSSTRR